MEDIFVIILTLVIAVFGALNRKKKKAAAQTPVAGQTKEPPGFWEMIMDEKEAGVEPVVEYAEPEPGYVEAEPAARKYSTIEKPSYAFSAANEGKSDIKEELKPVQKKKRQIAIGGEGFSLKKAVIYSEILNRKYS